MNPHRLAVIGVWLLLLLPSFARAEDWMLTSAPSTNWTAIVCSADGTKVAGAVGGKYGAFPWPGPIYVSTNAGATWFPSSAPVTNWSVLASSADGSRLAAGTF